MISCLANFVAYRKCDAFIFTLEPVHEVLYTFKSYRVENNSLLLKLMLCIRCGKTNSNKILSKNMLSFCLSLKLFYEVFEILNQRYLSLYNVSPGAICYIAVSFEFIWVIL